MSPDVREADVDRDLHASFDRLIELEQRLFADLAEGHDTALIAGSLLVSAVEHLDWRAALLARAGKDGRSFEPFASEGPVREGLAVMAEPDGLFAQVYAGGTARQVALPDGAGTAVVVPVHLGRDVLGVLAAHAPPERASPGDAVSFLAGVATLCAPLVGRGPLPLGDSRNVEQVLRAHKLESLGHLAGGIAHDFNNVLGVILGYVELAKMNLPETDTKVQRHLQLALATLGRARTLADRLLDFARAEAVTTDLCDLNEAVQEVRELLSETLDRRIEFEVNLGADLPAPPLDTDRLRQVVTNLCLNASEAMPEGGRITVDTFRREVKPGGMPELPPGIYSALRVRDTGPGIPPEARERIFQPYYTTTPGSRSGMGLWVVRGLIEKYDGRVLVGGDARGAVFTVWLPSELRVWPRDSDLDGDDAEGARHADVLVVDDEPGVREITRAFLEMEGYSVLEAGTGEEALQILQARPIGVRVVLLDHLLPDVQGSELAWRIDRLERAPRLVLVTGLPDAAAQADLPPGTALLPKPFLHDDVIRLLQDELGIEPTPVDGDA